MTDRTPRFRMLSRWIVALAMVPLLLAATLPAVLPLLRGTTQATSEPTPSGDAPTAAPSPTAPDVRDTFLPLTGDADLEFVLGSRGGGLLQPIVQPTDTPTPTPTDAPVLPRTEPVPDPAHDAGLFEDLLRTVLPKETVDGLPDFFVPDDAVFYVKSDFLNLRAGPGTEFEIVHKLTYAEKVTRTAYGVDWSRVVTTDGKTGFVATQYLVVKKPAPKVSAADLLRAKVVAVAKAQLGVPYVHYAASPTAGFDCSGLVWYAYKMNGIAVPRSAISYATFGKRVTKAQLKPGDVLCWDTYRDGVTKLNHVTMYIGNGLMVEAPGGGKVVCISKLNGYYATLLDIRRIIQ